MVTPLLLDVDGVLDVLDALDDGDPSSGRSGGIGRASADGRSWPFAGRTDHEDVTAHAAVAPAVPDELTRRWWKHDVVRRLIGLSPGYLDILEAALGCRSADRSRWRHADRST